MAGAIEHFGLNPLSGARELGTVGLTLSGFVFVGLNPLSGARELGTRGDFLVRDTGDPKV